MDFNHEDYTIAWICALPIEMAVAKAMMDEIHVPLSQETSDQNSYTLGNVSGHNVVISCLPSGVYGTTSAATVLVHMQLTFPALQFGLMVGIGGGVPSVNADIRLGDVVVSTPTPRFGGVIQYDYGKALHDGQFHTTSSLNKPPSVLLTAISQLRSDAMIKDSRLTHILSTTWERNPQLRYQCQRPPVDCLFDAEYSHEGVLDHTVDCSGCDTRRLVYRQSRDIDEPQIHYGLIASGNQVLKDAKRRDRLAAEWGIYCFEMEAAGVMDQLPCLVIRGICDYCDSHKNKQWQGYAALTAAAYAKLLLGAVPCHARKAATKHKTELSEAEKVCLEALFLSDPADDKNALKRRKGDHAPGTCDWILETDDLLNWLGQPSSAERCNSGILWLYGNPGIGKTTTAITLVEELPGHSLFRSSDKTLAYFFCDSSADNRRTATALLRGIIYQLIKQHLGLIKFLLSKYEVQKKNLLDSFDGLWAVLTSIAGDRESGDKYVIIDALDECDQISQATLLTQLVQTFSTSRDKESPRLGISFLFTSRPFPEIRQYLSQFDGQDLSSYAEVKKDLRAFIDDKVQTLRDLHNYSPAITLRVSTILEEKSEGTFLWAGLACDELRTTRSRDAVRKLESLPKGLHSLYQNLFEASQACADDDRKTVTQMLGFVAVSHRALSVSELAEACKLYEHEDEETRQRFTREDIDLCRLILIVQDGLVRLLHKSVRDFLVRGTGSNLIDESSVHASLANRCLDHLISKLPQLESKKSSLLDEGFLKYSIFHWPDHAGAAGDDFNVMPAHDVFFRPRSEKWEQWLGLYNRGAPSSELASGTTPLHVAARWGIPQLASFALASNNIGGKPIHSTESGKVLDYLDRGFLIENGKTPMQEAAEYGQVTVMRVLLGAKAAASDISENVLCAAAENEMNGKLLIQLLLTNQAPYIQITERTLQAAAGNWKHGLDIMNDVLLYMQKTGVTISVTEGIARAAILNLTSGQQVIALLLSQQWPRVEVSAAEEICSSFDANIIQLLLRASQADSFQLTRNLVRATARNRKHCQPVMRVLLAHQGLGILPETMETICASLDTDIVKMAVEQQESFHITPGIVEASRSNKTHGLSIMQLLLRRNRAMIIPEVELQIYSLFDVETVKLLLTNLSNTFQLTESAIRAAAQNRAHGSGVLEALLDQHGCVLSSDVCETICKCFEAATVSNIVTSRKRGTPITEGMLLSAASNTIDGTDVVRLLLAEQEDRSQTLVTEAVLIAGVSNHMNGFEVTQILLDHQGENVAITEAVLVAAVQNRMTGMKVVAVLLAQLEHKIEVTEPLVMAAVNNQPLGSKIMEFLLRECRQYVTPGAAALICERFGVEVITLLLFCTNISLPEIGGLTMPIPLTVPVARAAAANKQDGPVMIKALLNQDTVQITAAAVEVICGFCDADAVMVLMDRLGGGFQPTHRIIEAASRNQRYGLDIVDLLLQRRKLPLEITVDLIRAPAANPDTCGRVMEIFIKHGAMNMTAEAITTALAYYDADIARLIFRAGRVQITDELFQAAARNERHGCEVLGALIDLHGETPPISEQLFYVAARNIAVGPEVIKLLLRRGKLAMTEEVLRTACKRLDPGTLAFVLQSCNGPLTITGCIARSVAHNTIDPEGVVKALLVHDRVHFTTSAVTSFIKHFGAALVMALLDRDGFNASALESFLEAAARNRANGPKMIELLLSLHSGLVSIRVNEAMVTAAASNPREGAQVLKLLLKRLMLPTTAAAIHAIFASFDENIIAEFLDQQINFQVTEGVIQAITKNPACSSAIMHLILQDSQLSITTEAMSMICDIFDKSIVLALFSDNREIPEESIERILKAVAGNFSIDVETMRELFNRPWAPNHVPEAVFEGAASNWVHGGKIFGYFFELGNHKLNITTRLMEIVVDNEFAGAHIISMLIKASSTRVKELISNKILVAAGASGQKQILDTLSQVLSVEIPDNIRALARLYRASCNGDDGSVRHLLANGVPPDLPNRRNIAPIGVAAANGHIYVVKQLLSTGAVNVNRRSVAGRSPLFFPAIHGDAQVVKALLRAGADPSFPDKQGETAASLARRHGHHKVVRLLGRDWVSS